MLFNHHSWHYCNVLEPSTNFFSHPTIDHHFTRVNLQMKGEVSLIVPSDWTKIWRQDLLPQSPWGSSAAGHCRRCLLQKSNIAIINYKRMKWAELLVGRIWDQYIEKSQKAVRLWNGRLWALNNHRWLGPLPGTRPLLPALQLEGGPSFQPTPQHLLPAPLHCLPAWAPEAQSLRFHFKPTCVETLLPYFPTSEQFLFHWKRSIAASFFTGQVLLPLISGLSSLCSPESKFP